MSKACPTSETRLNAATNALRATISAEPLDPSEAEFRLTTVSAGAWVTVVVCVPVLTYAVMVSRGAHRSLFLAVWVVGLCGGFVALALPWRTIVGSRWRELVFLIWTMIDLALIGVAAIADGGPTSPMTSLFFIPIVFVGGSYPTFSVKLVGALSVIGYASFALAYGEPLGRLVLVLGGLGAAALMAWLHAQNHERRRLELARASITDPLTGALNRRGLDAAARASLAALQRSDTPVALILIDLDDFKTYNDNHGHAAGDALLAWIVERARGELRPMDSVARIGGDEFAVLVANADARGAAKVAQRIGTACSDRVSPASASRARRRTAATSTLCTGWPTGRCTQQSASAGRWGAVRQRSAPAPGASPT